MTRRLVLCLLLVSAFIFFAVKTYDTSFRCPTGYRCQWDSHGPSVLIEHSIVVTPSTGYLEMEGR